MSPRIPSRFRRASGFTLVEISISIGVVAFAMIAMLGLLPVGLTTFQEASTLSVRSQIVQAISNEIARSDSTNIAATEYYFDNEGNRLEAGQVGRVYTASVSVANLDEALGLNEDAGQRVIITVRNLRTQNTGGPDAELSYPIIIPNT
jgi:uncharacterized protein (TIGR02598 family)